MARFTLLLVLIVALAVASAFRRKKRPGKGTTSEGTTKKAQTSKPNILFIVADDLGWNDVGWHNEDVKTPNLDELAYGGVILNQSYYNPICTPSRSSFMTGFYPYHIGTQHSVFFHMKPQGVPLKYTFLPEKLREQGYATHMVGKWHLGFCNWNYTPTYRGFDSFYGYYEAEENYYNHSWPEESLLIDLRDNEEVVRDRGEEYGPDFFTTQVVEKIGDHPKDQPLFMYVPFQNVHRPLDEVPETYTRNMYRDEKDKRRILLDMVSNLDDNVGRIVDAMKEAELWNNTLLIFSTDNGGWPEYYGNNYPLKGGKFTLWEGGTRGVAFVHGSMVENSGYTNDKMIHAVDWFPTILAAAGGTPDDGIAIDGVNQLDVILRDGDAVRDEFVYNIDEEIPCLKQGAIRVGDYKLIEGYVGKDEDGKPLVDTWLFNLKEDPTETTNLTMPTKYEEMKERLEYYKRTMVPAINPPRDPRSLPIHWDGAWSPGWC